MGSLLFMYLWVFLLSPVITTIVAITLIAGNIGSDRFKIVMLTIFPASIYTICLFLIFPSTFYGLGLFVLFVLGVLVVVVFTSPWKFLSGLSFSDTHLKIRYLNIFLRKKEASFPLEEIKEIHLGEMKRLQDMPAKLRIKLREAETKFTILNKKTWRDIFDHIRLTNRNFPFVTNQ